MLLDGCGTEYRSGRIILPKDWLFRPKVTQWWEPQGDKTHFKITAKGIGGCVLWQGNFTDLAKALSFWQSLQEIGPAPHEWDMPTPSWYPGLYIPGIVYEFATVTTFTSVGTTSWPTPGLVTNTDYCVVAGGGGGSVDSAFNSFYQGNGGGGGGGAGGILSGTLPLTAGVSNTVTVGAGGAVATNGSNSVFRSITSNGGGAGGNASAGGAGSAGGSGGGGTPAASGATPGAGGAGTAGQGNAGAAGGANSASFYAGDGGGGGGAAAAGSAHIGGAGITCSINGQIYSAGGYGANANGNGAAGAPNTGNGGTGAGATYSAGAGGSGIVVLSFTPGYLVWFNKRHYLRR